MTSNEAIRYQLKKLKGKPLKEKVEHIFTYFWGPILGIVVALILCGSFLYNYLTAKEEALNAVLLNCFAAADDTDMISREFAQSAGIDLEEYEVYLATGMMVSDAMSQDTYEAIQAMSARVAAGTVDVMVGDLDALGIFLYQDYFCDLSELLTEEQLAELSDYVLYIDLNYMEAKLSGEDVPVPYPDPRKPEEMEKPIPAALLLPKENTFRKTCYPGISSDIAVGVVVNTENRQNAVSFLDYIFRITQ